MTHPAEAVRPEERLVVSPSEWSEWIEQWRGSGLSQREFCRRHGLAMATFNRKVVALLGRSCRCGQVTRPETESPRWLEVRMSASGVGRTGELEEVSGGGFELVVQGRWRVRLGPQFDAEGLRRLLGVLESPAC
jgi:hypothetical protein